MMTLNFAMIAMMVGSNMLPMHTENINAPVTMPAPQIEVIDKDVVPAAPIEKKEISNGVNQDKTREQCMKEAFDRIYEEVNRLLEQIPEKAQEQFQLQNTM